MSDRIINIASWPAERRVLASVQLQPKAPLISGWVWMVAAAFAAGLWAVEIIQAVTR